MPAARRIFTQSDADRIDASTQSPVSVVHPDGTVDRYAASADTDAARGAALLEARAAATSGDTIHVYVDATITGPLGKDGVDWWFAPGVTINHESNDQSYTFGDGGSAVSYTVSGRANFIRKNAAGTPSSPDLGSEVWGFAQTRNAGSDISIECETLHVEIDNNGPYAINGFGCDGRAGKLSVKYRYGSSSNTNTNGCIFYMHYWENGRMSVKFDEYEMLSSVPANGDHVPFYNLVVDAPTDDLYITGESVKAWDTLTDVLLFSSENANAASWIDIHRITGVIHHNNSDKVYIDCQKLIGRVRADSPAYAGKLYLNFMKITGDFASGTNDYIAIAGTGRAWLNVMQFEPGTNAGRLVSITGSTVDLDGQDFTATTGQDAIRCAGAAATLNMLSGKITPASGKKSLVQASSGTLNVSAAVAYLTADATGSITKLPTYGAVPP